MPQCKSKTEKSINYDTKKYTNNMSVSVEVNSINRYADEYTVNLETFINQILMRSDRYEVSADSFADAISKAHTQHYNHLMGE